MCFKTSWMSSSIARIAYTLWWWWEQKHEKEINSKIRERKEDTAKDPDRCLYFIHLEVCSLCSCVVLIDDRDSNQAFHIMRRTVGKANVTGIEANLLISRPRWGLIRRAGIIISLQLIRSRICSTCVCIDIVLRHICEYSFGFTAKKIAIKKMCQWR